jgi:hypothetical protein
VAFAHPSRASCFYQDVCDTWLYQDCGSGCWGLVLVGDCQWGSGCYQPLGCDQGYCEKYFFHVTGLDEGHCDLCFSDPVEFCTEC